MINKILEEKKLYANTCIYVDYENIFELLKKYGKTPTQIEFFPKIKEKLYNDMNLNIIDFIVYSNFERKSLFDGNHQTTLQSYGVQTRHTSNNGKNSGDLELTVDALRTLYKNTNIDVFVIISSDRDIIPLIKAIKSENKTSYIFSTKNGFDKVVADYADYHSYLEDLFSLSEVDLINNSADQEYIFDSLTETDKIQAQEVSKLFYDSRLWERYEENPTVKITLVGYTAMISNTVSRLKEEIEYNFQVAHHLRYITLYDDSQKGVCIKDGENRNELYE